jgi:hypothetical protein
MQIDTNRVGEELHRLYKEFPLFLKGADLDDKSNQQQIFDFVTDPRSQEILDTILKRYPDLKQLERTLGRAFARYNLLFDRGTKIPRIYTYLSFLDYENRVIFVDTALVIAIDMYLGAHCQFYDAIALPMYIRRRLDYEFIAPDAMRAVAHYELERTPQPLQTLLDHMVLHGKVAYFLEKVLPESTSADRFGFTPEQMAWCRRSEQMMWSHLVGSKLLFEQNSFRFRAFIGESPTVQIFPGSPGRVGHFIGYRIVRRYMENTGSTFPELFAETDAQKILRLSNYRP